MARKSWRPYRIVYRGSSVEVNQAVFHEALQNGCTTVCETDRRKAYVRDDLRMYEDAQTGQTRFVLRRSPEHDPHGIPSSWRLIERLSVYLIPRVERA